MGSMSKALFVETNPGPVKHVLAELGLIESGELRPPLAPPTERSRALLKPAIARMRAALAQ